MTREEAIEQLQDAKDGYKEYLSNEALEMAIKALEQEPCEDCISREQAKGAIRDKFKDLPSRVEINTILNELPSVTPQPKTGHWVYGYTYPDGQYRKCSACKELIKVVANDGNFCAHCGAKMDEREVQE